MHFFQLASLLLLHNYFSVAIDYMYSLILLRLPQYHFLTLGGSYLVILNFSFFVDECAFRISDDIHCSVF